MVDRAPSSGKADQTEVMPAVRRFFGTVTLDPTRVGRDAGRIADEVIVHLMGCACGLTYADVAADMEWHDLAGVGVPVASPSALVRTKDTYRPQDMIDRSFLHQLLERRRRE